MHAARDWHGRFSGEGTQTDRNTPVPAAQAPVFISIQPFPVSPLEQDYSEGRNPSVLLSVSFVGSRAVFPPVS